MSFRKTLAAALVVFLTAEALGAIFVFAIMGGPDIAQSVAFMLGSAAAALGALAFLGLKLAGRTTSPVLGAIVGGALIALVLALTSISVSSAGLFILPAAGALIGGTSAFAGLLTLRRLGL